MARGAGQGVRGAGKLRSDIVAPATGRLEADATARRNKDGSLMQDLDVIKVSITDKSKLRSDVYPPMIVDEAPDKSRPADAVAAAIELRARAEATSEELFPAFRALAKANGGDLRDTEFRCKTTDSLARKIDNDARHEKISMAAAAAKIGDAARFTLTFPEDKMYDAVQSTLKDLESRGFTVDKIKNFWGRGDTYDGFNINIIDKNGVKSELQIHSDRSFYVARRGHVLYEEFRKETVDDDYRWALHTGMVTFAKSVAKPANYEKLLAIGKQARMEFNPLNPNFTPNDE